MTKEKPGRATRRRDAAAAKRQRKSVETAAAAVKKWMSDQHVMEKLAHHGEVERQEVMDPKHWHITTYSRSHRYGPTYHVRKGPGGGTFAASLSAPRFGALVCALLNAYEAATGEDVVALMDR